MAIIDKYPYNLLTDYQIEGNNITENTPYEIFDIPARNLIRPERFDLLAKLIYIHAKGIGAGIEWSTGIYKDTIDAFSCGNFTEPGTAEKNSFQKYLDTFDALIEEIKENGVDCTKSLIPIGRENILLDGAHRVSIAAYYGQTVRVIKFPDFTRNMNYEYFRKYLMREENLAHMARIYSHIRGNCYLACLWPKGDSGRHAEALAEISKVGKIVYVGDVYLTYNGMKNFMTQIYGHQAWTGTIDDGFQGTNGKAMACYDKEKPVKTVLFEASDLETVVEVKAKVRQLYGIENHSVHISDTQEETEMMAELLYNQNSVKFLNFAMPYRFKHIFTEIPRLKKLICEKGYSLEHFIVDSSAVLEVYGIREARDIDYLTDVSGRDDLLEGVERHDSQLQYYQMSIPEMLYNPENYFVYNGMKFLDIDHVLAMKAVRGERKDKNDIKLSCKHMQSFTKIPKRFRAETKGRILQYMKRKHRYGCCPYTYGEYVLERIKEPLRQVRRLIRVMRSSVWMKKLEKRF